MDDKIQAIFNINPKLASSEDISNVVKQAEQLLQDIKAAEARALRREAKAEIEAKKSAYGPSTPIYKIEYMWNTIVIELERIFSENGSITKDEFYNVIKTNKYTYKQPKEKVWTCPMCGGGHLRVARYADKEPN